MINIGKVINTKCSNYVGNRVFPIVAEQTTKKPFICYNRESAFPETTKDRYMYEMEHNVQINIVTDKYDEGIELLEDVVNEFDDFEGEVNGINVVDSKIKNINERYMNNAYIQTININLKTN